MSYMINVIRDMEGRGINSFDSVGSALLVYFSGKTNCMSPYIEVR
jgi:hypothetical protein